MAASVRRDLHLDVKMVEGHYGEFTVLMDGDVILSGGPLAFLGVLPSAQEVRKAIENRLRAGPVSG